MPVNVDGNILESGDLTSTGQLKRSIVTDGLEVYYDVNNSYSWPGSGGTWYNIVNNHSHLTLYNGISTSTFAGVQAWNFNSDGDRFEGDYQGTGMTGNSTFEAWIYPGASEVTSGDRGTIILHNGGDAQYMSWNKSNNYLSSYWYGSTDNGYHEQVGPSSRSTWTHWCTAWDSRAGRLFQYVDGINTGVATTTNSGTPNDYLKIGRESTTRQFSGAMAEIRIYSRALRPDEVMLNFFSTKDKYGL